jgi:hypothetical protein
VDLIGTWEGEGVVPPRAGAVAERLLSLMVVDLRCGVETRLASGHDEAVETWHQAQSMIADVDGYLHRIERELLFGAEVGSWDAETRRDVHWLLEAQAILRWALCLVDGQPEHDALVRPSTFSASPLLSPGSFVEEAHLRPIEALEASEAFWSFWLWRANAGPFRGRRLLPPHVRENVEEATTQSILDPGMLMEGDASAFGMPVFRLPEEEQELLVSIATERCRAARWLCGHAEGFYEISLDVSPL